MSGALLAIFLWVFCSIIAAVIADARGRSVPGWAVGGFIFGPFAILLVALLPPIAPSEQQQIEAGNLQKCPECAELVRAEAVKCRHCGAALHNRQPEASITNELADRIAQINK